MAGNRETYHITRCKARKHRNLTRSASHHFHQTQAIDGGLGLHLGTKYCALGFFHGGIKTKGPVDQWEVCRHGIQGEKRRQGAPQKVCVSKKPGGKTPRPHDV